MLSSRQSTHASLTLKLVPFLACLQGCFGMCGGGDQEFYAEQGCIDGEDESDPKIVIGTSEGEAFKVLSNGAELEMDYGPQGGQHIYVSYRVFGAQTGDRVKLQLSSGGSSNGTQGVYPPDCAEGQAWEILDDYVEFQMAEEQKTTVIVSLVRCSLTQEECENDYELTNYEVVTSGEVDVSVTP